MKATPPIVNFNSGEVSPLIDARSDLSKYSSACQILENAFPLVEGDAKKIPGSYYVCPAQNSNLKARLIPFSFSTIQEYVIEMGNQYMRFYMNGGQILVDPSQALDFSPTSVYPAGIYTKVGPYGEFTWAGGIQLDISFPYSATPPTSISVAANSSDALSVSVVSGTLTIKLANTTASKNLADLIKAAIYALGTSGGVDYTKAVVTANSAYTASTPITSPSASHFYNTNTMYQCTTAVIPLAGSGYFFWDAGDQLTVSYATPQWSQIPGTTGPPIKCTVNDSDFLNVSMVSGTNGTYLTIQLANATPAKNTVALIQTAIQAMGQINGVPYWNVTVSGNAAYTTGAPTTAPQPSFWGNNTSIFPTTAANWTLVSVGATVQIPTPYLEADLFELDLDTQSADVLFICHQNYPPAKLMRYSHINWELRPLYCMGTLDIAKTGIGGIAVPISWVGNNSSHYVSPAGIELGNPTGVCPFVVGDSVFISGIEGDASILNLNIYTVLAIGMPSNSAPNAILINATLANVINASEGSGIVVRVDRLFNAPGDYPACCALYEQRLYLAGSANNPLRFNGSVQGDFENFISDPSQDDYAVQYDIDSGDVDAIRWMIGQQQLMLGTAGGIFRASGAGTDNPITQNSIDVKKQVFTGVGNIHPVLAGDSIIWITRSANLVRLLVYVWQEDKWVNPDLTRLARHITIGANRANSGIVQAAFQKEPYPILWAVRADGQLLGMLFDAEEKIYAWFRKTTQGIIESVACISQDNNEDQVWMIVNRTLNGATVRCIEYLTPQELFHQLNNAFFVDCGLTWQGVGPATITGITNANPAVVTCPSHPFTNGMHVSISGVVGMPNANNPNTRAFTVEGKTTNTFQLYGTNSTSWGTYTSGGTAIQVTEILTGLSYLNGETVVGIEDGAAIPPQVVAGGQITLGVFGNLISVGLPYTTTITPMKLNAGSHQGTARGKRQKINKFTFSFYETVGCKFGRDANTLFDIPFGTGVQPTLFTGDITMDFPGQWEREAELTIVHNQPLPFTLRCIVPRVTVEDEDGSDANAGQILSKTNKNKA